jgi:large subunit ribosomal protein L4
VYKARENKIVVVEDLSMEAPKTKDFSAMLDALRGESYKTLVVLPEYNENVYLSARNLCDNKMVALSDMNTYDLVNAHVVIFTESAAKMFSEEPAEEAAA